jgi:hypothetical protein
MTFAGYASLTAYLAHWRALLEDHAKGGSAPEPALLAQMNRAIEDILGADRQYLLEEPADSAARRRRDRAEVKLRHALIARGVLAG